MKKAKKWLLILLVLIIAGVIFWWWQSRRNQAPDYSTVSVISGPLIQTVSESGTVKPVKEVALNFLSSGRVKELKVAVGDKVVSGQTIASLDGTALETRKAEALAGLRIAEASLAKTLAGASSETVAVSRSNIEQAQAGVDSAKSDLNQVKKSAAENIKQAEKTLSDLESSAPGTLTIQEQAVSVAQTALENARKTAAKNIDNAKSSAIITFNDKILSAKVALDNINTILDDEYAKPVLSAKNASYLAKTKDSRFEALSLVSAAESAAASAQSAGDEKSINNAAEKVGSLLAKTDSALDYAYSMLESTVTSSTFSQSKLDSYKTMISGQSAQANQASTAVESAAQSFHNAVLGADTSIAAAQEGLLQSQASLANATLAARNALSSIRIAGEQQIASASSRLLSAEKTLAVTKAQLASTVAPARSQDVALSQAQVSQAQANVASIEQQISETVLLAPLDGVITAVNYEPGEQFGVGGKPMVSMLVNNSFNVEVDIAESNISKVKVGDNVALTVDAFPDDFVLEGLVSFVEPAQTLIQDVVYYKVKIDFKDLAATMSAIEARGLSLKSGMTVDAVITTAKRDKALQVPARSVIEKNNSKFVRILENGNMVEVPVETGLRGDEGMLEILSGVKENDTVVTFVKNAAAN